MKNIPHTPMFVCEEELLEKNLKILDKIQERTGAKILLALKGFSLYSTFPLISKYLHGCCASGLNEAKLAKEEFKKEVHTYSPAFKEEEIEEILEISDHVVFNSVSQIKKYREEAKKKASIGLRINPEISCSPVEMYSPCGAYSRLGTTIENFDEEILQDLDGLHFHALCEESAEALEKVLASFEEKFGKYIKDLEWVNFGGGHHITRTDYDTEHLTKIINDFRSRHNNIPVYLEPGEAIGLNTGVLVATVLDIIDNGKKIAILDTSKEAHMLDSVIMPYKVEVRGAGEPDEKKFNYLLGGNSCLAGDVIGEYSFDKEIQIGDKIIFEDMIHYTMVKTTTFNGVNLPSIAILKKDGELEVVKTFGYEEFKSRI
ncbi:MAG: carboxynorspermidine decarboxylase [Campylobacterales bacterium]|nr:carboxynorspermidine decarboxylase [Campylobacterales bacterium]